MDDEPEVLLLRASDRDALIYAASKGDEFAVTLLAAISSVVLVATARGGGVPCCRCRKVMRRIRKVQRTAFAVAYWPEGDVHSMIFCERCADGHDNAELRESAITSLLASLRTEWAQQRGSTFVAGAGRA